MSTLEAEMPIELDVEHERDVPHAAKPESALKSFLSGGVGGESVSHRYLLPGLLHRTGNDSVYPD